ncbi:MAG: sensor histidine kinase [Deltaproteobacteria bacterium]|nr:sensor histidine kinase [Deltaproteobacteria bacterium]
MESSARRTATRLRRLFRRLAADGRDEQDRRRAERLVQWLRWLAVGSWAWLIRGIAPGFDPWIVHGVYGGALAYAAVCDVLVRRSSSIGATSVLTTLGDTVAVAAMCFVTGGIGSPIFPVFLLSVLATAIRFGMAEAFAIASLDVLHATLLYATVGGGRSSDLARGVFYLYFVALMGGLLSGEARRQHRRAVSERERASLLLSLNRQIIAAADLSELLARILAETLRVVPSRGACILLRRGGEGVPERLVTAGDLAPPSRAEAEALLGSDAVLEANRVGCVILKDAEEIRRRARGEWIERLAPERLAIVAVRGTTELGVVVLVDHGRDAVSSAEEEEEESGVLGAVAEEAAVAIENAKLGAALVEAQARSRELLRRVIDAEEAERRRIAGELHDRMGKRFFEFYYDVRLLQGMSVDRDPAGSEILARITESARECAAEIRTLMDDLRPSVLDDFGFLEALKEFVTGIAARGELAITLSVDESGPSAGPQADLMLFRVLQEAVFNARKHAAAKRVWIEFGPHAGRQLRLVVRDDGCGFEPDAPNPGHYGLLYMKERAEACGGKFAVRSTPRRGTEIEVTVPLPR